MRPRKAAVARVGLELPHSAAGGRKTRAFQGLDDAGSDANERSGPGGLGQTSALDAAGEPDAIERALADALTRASAAGEWSTVAQLARELEARRVARSAPEVVSIAAARAKRGGGAS